MTKRQDRYSWAVTALISMNVFTLLFLGWSFVCYGSPWIAVHVVRGKPLVVDATTKSFGAAEPGQTIEVSFLFTNYGNDPIRVVGRRVICDCMVPDDRPFQLDPGQSHSYQFTIELPDEPQAIHRSVSIYTNIPGQTEIELAIIGEVVHKNDKVAARD